MNFEFNDFQGSVLQKTEAYKIYVTNLSFCISICFFFGSSSQESMSQDEKYHIYSTIVESMKNV